MSKTTETLANLFIILVTSLITLGLLEVAANVYLTDYATAEQFNRYASWKQLRQKQQDQAVRVSAHRYLGYYPTPGWSEGDNRHNSRGFRGDEIPLEKAPGEFRIVCLGGSTTYTSAVPDYRKSYPAQLQAALRKAGYDNVTVINAGLYDYTSWESLINFQFRALDLDPDLVIVYHAINDIESRFVWPPAAYHGDNSGARVADTGIFSPGLLEHSAIGRILLIKAGLAKPHSTLARLFIARPETSYMEEYDRQTVSKSYPENIFTEVTPEKMLQTNPPVYFKRNLENLIAIADFRGIDVILSTMAFIPVSPEANNRGGSPLFWAAMNEHNQVMRDITNNTSAYLLDFSALFPKDAGLYETDGIHLNEAGALEKARIFSEFIQKSNLVTRPQ